MFEGSSIDQQQLNEIKARYGIGSRSSGPSRFPIMLIRPSHYDDDGYVIQWYRAAVPSDSLAAMHGRVREFRQRKVLGEHVRIEIRALDEADTRIRPPRLARELKNGGLVVLAGVQPDQFPRAMDIALPLRVGGVQVCMEGAHVTESLRRGGVTAELQEAMNLGISLVAGEATEDELDNLLRDAWRSEMKPLYNYLDDQAAQERTPMSMRSSETAWETIGQYARFDGVTPIRCSFASLRDAADPAAQSRTVEEVERFVRDNVHQGAGRFFVTDEDFAQNPEWEEIFDRLIAMREQEKLDIGFVLRAKTASESEPRFMEKAIRAGVSRIVVDIENVHAQNSGGSGENQRTLAACRRTILAWKRAGAMVFCEYPIGAAGDAAEIVQDIRTIQKELAVDLLEPYWMTPAPGQEGLPKPGGTEVVPVAEGNQPELERAAAGRTAAAEQRARLCRDAWREYYTTGHMETVLRRAAATGIRLDSMMFLLLWFHFCVVYEKVDPVEGGYLRRKYRAGRRPALPREGWLRFWARCGADQVYKHWKLLRLYLRFRRFIVELKIKGAGKNYTDSALTPEGSTHEGARESVLPRIAVAP